MASRDVRVRAWTLAAGIPLMVATAALLYLLRSRDPCVEQSHKYGPGSTQAQGATEQVSPSDGARDPTPIGHPEGAARGAASGATVRLRVLRAGTRNPVTGALVDLVTRTGCGRVAHTGADGLAEIRDTPAGGPYRIELRAGDEPMQVVHGIFVRTSETLDLGTLVLGEVGFVTGRVVDEAGRPLPGASIELRPSTQLALQSSRMLRLVGRARPLADPIARVASDERGEFVVQGLPLGTYEMHARLRGRATWRLERLVPAASGPLRPIRVVLGPAVDLTGRVTDERGHALEEVHLLAERAPEEERFTQPLGLRERATTDAHGRYRLEGLAPGARYVFTLLVPDGCVRTDGRAMQVPEGGGVRDFVVRTGGVLEGTVRWRAGAEPIPQARVQVLTGRGEPRTPGRYLLSSASVVTDAAGRFRIEGLAPGPASCRVEARGFATALFGLAEDADLALVRAGEVVDVLLELDEAGWVEGVVRRKPDGRTIPNAVIRAVRSQGGVPKAFLAGAPSTRSDTRGRFRLDGLESGAWLLVATAPGYTSQLPIGTHVEIPPEGGHVRIEVPMTLTASIIGRVRDANGRAVVGAQLSAVVADLPAAARGDDPGVALLLADPPTCRSGAVGEYELSDLQPGIVWHVRVAADDLVGTTVHIPRLGAGDRRQLDVLLLDGAAVSGRVVDEVGRPVRGAVVRIGLPQDELDVAPPFLEGWHGLAKDPRRLVTDDRGRFEVTGLRPGVIVFRADHPDHGPAYGRVVQAEMAGHIEEYVIRLPRGKRLAGTVFATDGVAIPGALVWIVRARGDDGPSAEGDGFLPSDVLGSVRTDARGRFSLVVEDDAAPFAVVWSAPGHLAWNRDRSERAVLRSPIPLPDGMEFRLVPRGPLER